MDRSDEPAEEIPLNEIDGVVPNINKPLRVNFYYQTDAFRTKIVKAKIFYPNRNFMWTLNMKSFETVYALSRVLLMVPDKVVTAFMINKENLPDPDDGTFLINLVVDLLQVYIDKDRLMMRFEDIDNMNDIQIKKVDLGLDQEPDEAEMGQSLADMLTFISNKLKELQRLLAEKRHEEFQREVELFVQLCDDVRIACHVYLDLIYPVWNNTLRSGSFDDKKIQENKVVLLQMLERTNEKLEKEYRHLLIKNSIED